MAGVTEQEAEIFEALHAKASQGAPLTEQEMMAYEDIYARASAPEGRTGYGLNIAAGTVEGLPQMAGGMADLARMGTEWAIPPGVEVGPGGGDPYAAPQAPVQPPEGGYGQQWGQAALGATGLEDVVPGTPGQAVARTGAAGLVSVAPFAMTGGLAAPAWLARGGMMASGLSGGLAAGAAEQAEWSAGAQAVAGLLGSFTPAGVVGAARGAMKIIASSAAKGAGRAARPGVRRAIDVVSDPSFYDEAGRVSEPARFVKELRASVGGDDVLETLANEMGPRLGMTKDEVLTYFDEVAEYVDASLMPHQLPGAPSAIQRLEGQLSHVSDDFQTHVDKGVEIASRKAAEHLDETLVRSGRVAKRVGDRANKMLEKSSQIYDELERIPDFTLSTRGAKGVLHRMRKQYSRAPVDEDKILGHKDMEYYAGLIDEWDNRVTFHELRRTRKNMLEAAEVAAAKGQNEVSGALKQMAYAIRNSWDEARATAPGTDEARWIAKLGRANKMRSHFEKVYTKAQDAELGRAFDIKRQGVSASARSGLDSEGSWKGVQSIFRDTRHGVRRGQMLRREVMRSGKGGAEDLEAEVLRALMPRDSGAVGQRLQYAINQVDEHGARLAPILGGRAKVRELRKSLDILQRSLKRSNPHSTGSAKLPKGEQIMRQEAERMMREKGRISFADVLFSAEGGMLTANIGGPATVLAATTPITAPQVAVAGAAIAGPRALSRWVQLQDAVVLHSLQKAAMYDSKLMRELANAMPSSSFAKDQMRLANLMLRSGAITTTDDLVALGNEIAGD